MSLFGDTPETATGFDERVPIPDLHYERAEQLRLEKEMLGLYVSDHPLRGLEHVLARRATCAIVDVVDRTEDNITLAGVITGCERKYTRKGEAMCTFTLEDMAGSIEVTVFPKTYLTQGHLVVDDQIVVVRGRLDRRDEARVMLMSSDIQVVDVPKTGTESLYIDLARRSVGASEVNEIRDLLREHAGDSPVFLKVGDRTVALGPDFAVSIPSVIGQLRAKFGEAVSIG